MWHITERTFELWLLSRGCSVAYLSIRSFKNNLAKHKLVWVVLVPCGLEKIAIGVQNKFSLGSPAVKTLAKLFTETRQLRATDT
jgi:long-chain acyl-CoA synthetase